MLLGFTEIEAVGDGGGGGGGGGGGAAFFLHAPNASKALSPTIRNNHFIACFTFIFLLRPQSMPPGARRSYLLFRYLLFPTPIRLRIMPGKRQLLNFRTIGQHGPDLQAARTIGLEHNMPSIRRP